MATFDICSRRFEGAPEAKAHSAYTALRPVGRVGLRSMSDAAQDSEPAFHLFLDSEEMPVLERALHLLIADEAHEPLIRGLAREVLTLLECPRGAEGKLTVPLSPEQMKITHTAAHLLLDDLQREQAGERELLRRVLGKLPDEHTMRAIELS